VDAMSEARALLLDALAEMGSLYPEGLLADIAATPSGAELIRRADRPEARVAEGLTVERCAGYDLSDRPDLAPNIVCTLPAGHTGYHLPAPRPPEPDRTAVLRTPMALWLASHKQSQGGLEFIVASEAEILAVEQQAISLAPTPDEAP
jgi:hypothetical protein